MADWYYYNENGEQIGPIRGKELKRLARQGTITPDTRVEDENGRTALARNVTGLTFAETAPTETESSSIILPPSATENLNERDFEQLQEDFERLQKQQERQQTTQNVAIPVPPAEENPFTATMPSDHNPFTTPMPVAVNPFVTPAPAVDTTTPKNVAVPAVEKTGKSSWKITVVGIVAVLIVGGIGWKILDDDWQARQRAEGAVKGQVQAAFDKEEDTAIIVEGGGGGGGQQAPVLPNPAPQPHQEPIIAMPITPDDDSVYYFNNTLAVSSSEHAIMAGDPAFIDSRNFAYITGVARNNFTSPLYGTRRIMDNVRSVYQVSGTYYFIKKNNELWAMGNNGLGQVGDDTGLNRSEPVLVMKDVANLYFTHRPGEPGRDAVLTVYALKTDKSRWAWGTGVKNGQIAFAPVKTDDYFNHNQQLLRDHVSMRHGNTASPQMDLFPGWPEPGWNVGFRVVLPEQYPGEISRVLGGRDNIDSMIVETADGANPIRSYALTKDGVLWGWGRNDGNLGDGTRADRDAPVKIAENVKRILPKYFVTKSNDWFYYSNRNSFRPYIAFRNALYVYTTSGIVNIADAQTWFTPDGRFVTSNRNNSGDEFHVGVIIRDIKLPSIVRTSDGHVIAPRPEQIVQRPTQPQQGGAPGGGNAGDGGSPSNNAPQVVQSLSYPYSMAGAPRYNGDNSSLTMRISAVATGNTNARFTQPSAEVVAFPPELNVTNVAVADDGRLLEISVSGLESNIRELARNATQRGNWRVRVGFGPHRQNPNGTVTADILKIELVQ